MLKINVVLKVQNGHNMSKYFLLISLINAFRTPQAPIVLEIWTSSNTNILKKKQNDRKKTTQHTINTQSRIACIRSQAWILENKVNRLFAYKYIIARGINIVYYFVLM